jgi:chaperonin GroEL (HSP60 family)
MQQHTGSASVMYILKTGSKQQLKFCVCCTGMNKMVINHLEKLFVTSDASTIVTEMDVYHPAAKLLVMAAKAQAGEVGDGTNLVSRDGLLG